MVRNEDLITNIASTIH